jgi:hypothetical protein
LEVRKGLSEARRSWRHPQGLPWQPSRCQAGAPALPMRAKAVFPGTCTFSPPCTCSVKFFSTSSRPGRYRTE